VLGDEAEAEQTPRRLVEQAGDDLGRVPGRGVDRSGGDRRSSPAYGNDHVCGSSM
jgi:hypothetical protein